MVLDARRVEVEETGPRVGIQVLNECGVSRETAWDKDRMNSSDHSGK